MPLLKETENTSKHERSATLIVDPTGEYFEKSRKDFEDYDQAVKDSNGPTDYLAETNYEGFGEGGNPRSRSGFFPDTFND
jgi:hypothetical protein